MEILVFRVDGRAPKKNQVNWEARRLGNGIVAEGKSLYRDGEWIGAVRRGIVTIRSDFLDLKMKSAPGR